MAFDKAEWQRQHRKKNPGQAAKALNDWRAKNRQDVRTNLNTWRLENPKSVNKGRTKIGKKKHYAQRLIHFMVKNNVLERGPCEVCGKPNGDGHHDDYDKPDQVRWLCNVHHRAWHTENGPGLNG